MFVLFSVGTFKTKGKDLVHSVLDAAFKAGYTSIGKILELALWCNSLKASLFEPECHKMRLEILGIATNGYYI